MVIDSSALLAIMQNEPERRQYLEAIATADTRLMSVAAFVETSIVLETRYGADGLRDLDLSSVRRGIPQTRITQETPPRRAAAESHPPQLVTDALSCPLLVPARRPSSSE